MFNYANAKAVDFVEIKFHLIIFGSLQKYDEDLYLNMMNLLEYELIISKFGTCP